MTKFNVGSVGDKVRILDGKALIGNSTGKVTTGKEYKIVSFHEKEETEVEHIKVADNHSGTFTICDYEYKYIELVESKPTKNQRITALETEVAELKLIVHELRDRPQLTTVVNNINGPSTINSVEDIIEFEGAKYRKVDRKACEGDYVVFNKIPDCGIARKSVIKGKPYKVHESDGIYKKYINDEMSDRLHVYGGGVLEGTPETVDVYELIVEEKSKIRGITIEIGKPLSPNEQRAAIIEKAKRFVTERQAIMLFGHVEFIVNADKRTIVALLKPSGLKQVVERGIAKCDPSDVFNEHIGKAIALGRALGLDVSEFEQAVQPNEVVVGQIITWNEVPTSLYMVDKREGDWFNFTNLKDNKNYNNHEYCEIEEFTTIINDTNAQYEVSK